MADKSFYLMHKKINDGDSEGCVELAKKCVLSALIALKALNVLIQQFRPREKPIDKRTRNDLIEVCYSVLNESDLSETATETEPAVTFYHIISGLEKEEESVLASKWLPLFNRSVQLFLNKEPFSTSPKARDVESCCYSLAIIFTKKGLHGAALPFYESYLTIAMKSPKAQSQMNSVASAVCGGLYVCRKALCQWSEFLCDLSKLLSCQATDNQNWRIMVEKYWCATKSELAKAQHSLQDFTLPGILGLTGIAISDSQREELLCWELKTYLQTNFSLSHMGSVNNVLKELAAFQTYKGMVLQLQAYCAMMTVLTSTDESSDERFDQAVILAKRSVSALAQYAEESHDAESAAGKMQLGLAYWCKYWTEWHRTRAKIETELERLGPLLKSSKPTIPGQEAKVDNDLTIPVYEYTHISREQKLLQTLEQSLKMFQSVSQCDYPEVPMSPTPWQILSCIRSLACAFSCYGHMNLKATAWQTCLEYALRFKEKEYIVLACSEILKLGFQVPQDLLTECDEYVQDVSAALPCYIKANYAVSIAWNKFHEEKYEECRAYLKEIRLKNEALNSPLTKSLNLVHAELHLLESYLGSVPLEPRAPEDDINFRAAARLAYEKAYSTAVNYTKHAKESGWVFPGQEHHVTAVVAETFVWTLQIALEGAMPSDLKAYCKEFVPYMQKRALLYKTVEGLLYRCHADLFCEDPQHCQVILTSVLQLMGLVKSVPTTPSPSVHKSVEADWSVKRGQRAPETVRASSNVLFSPVVSVESSTKSNPVSRNAGNLLDTPFVPDPSAWILYPEVANIGKSPTLKRKEISQPTWLSHSRHCRCIDCENLLLWWIAMQVMGVQGRCYSLQNSHEAVDSFKASWDILQRFLRKRCFQLPQSSQGAARSLQFLDKSRSDLEELVNRVQNISLTTVQWQQPTEVWIQPVLLVGAVNQMEHVMHLEAANRRQEACREMALLEERVFGEDFPLYTGLQSCSFAVRFTFLSYLRDKLKNDAQDAAKGAPLLKVIPPDIEETETVTPGCEVVQSEEAERPVTPVAPIPVPKLKGRPAVKGKKGVKRNPLFGDGQESESEEMTKSDVEEVEEVFTKKRLGLKTRPLIIESDGDENEVSEKEIKPTAKKTGKGTTKLQQSGTETAKEEELKPKRGRAGAKPQAAAKTATRLKKMPLVVEDGVEGVDKEDEKLVLESLGKAPQNRVRRKKAEEVDPSHETVEKVEKEDSPEVVVISSDDEEKKAKSVRNKVRTCRKKDGGQVAKSRAAGTKTDENANMGSSPVLPGNEPGSTEVLGTTTRMNGNSVEQAKTAQSGARSRRFRIAEDPEVATPEDAKTRRPRTRLPKNPFII